MKIFALLAAAVILPITLSAPAPAQAQQGGHSYTNVKHDGDRYRPYRRGVAPRRYAYNNRWRDDRRGDDRRDYRKRDKRDSKHARDYRKRDKRDSKYARDYRKRDKRDSKYARDYRKRDQGKRYSGRTYRSYPWGPNYNYPRRAHRYAYRAPSHRHQLHKHRRLSRDYIRRIALARYPSILRIVYGDGIYDVWVRDHYGRSFRLGYDAFSGAFLTFFFLT